MTVYIDRPIEADWWYNAEQPRGYAVPDELLDTPFFNRITRDKR